MASKNGPPVAPHSVPTLCPDLRDKFSQGVSYNLKVLLRGERNTGKTQLFNRLQGRSFTDEYTPTTEIQTAHIHWGAQEAKDVVKVEAWDVVDKAKGKRWPADKAYVAPGEDSGTQLLAGTRAVFHLADAETVDVYKNVSAVLLVVDPCKPWSFQYAEEEAQRIPAGTSVVLVANCRDMYDKWGVRQEQMKQFVEKQGRDYYYIECSALNGFGLTELYAFLNIPFLKLKEQALVERLRLIQQDLTKAQEAFALEQQSQSYEKFLEYLDTIRREREAEKAAAALEASSRTRRSASLPAAKKETWSAWFSRKLLRDKEIKSPKEEEKEEQHAPKREKRREKAKKEEEETADPNKEITSIEDFSLGKLDESFLEDEDEDEDEEEEEEEKSVHDADRGDSRRNDLVMGDEDLEGEGPTSEEEREGEEKKKTQESIPKKKKETLKIGAYDPAVAKELDDFYGNQEEPSDPYTKRPSFGVKAEKKKEEGEEEEEEEEEDRHTYDTLSFQTIEDGEDQEKNEDTTSRRRHRHRHHRNGEGSEERRKHRHRHSSSSDIRSHSSRSSATSRSSYHS